MRGGAVRPLSQHLVEFYLATYSLRTRKHEIVHKKATWWAYFVTVHSYCAGSYIGKFKFYMTAVSSTLLVVDPEIFRALHV